MNKLTDIDKSWTLFLDRDGVINKRIVDGYVTKCSDFVFIDGVIEAINALSRVFGKIVVVTNQQCVGKHLATMAEIDRVNEYMCNVVRTSGGRIDAVIVCPQLANEPDNYRKPDPKMAYMAKEMFPEIDFRRSMMVGDSETDVLFGKNASMVTIKVAGYSETADYNFDDLLEFSRHINNDEC